MKKKTLGWIIGLMGLSMIGLIGFQLYWINNLVKANDERFKKDVISALNAVASKLEREEVVMAFKKFNDVNSRVLRPAKKEELNPVPRNAGSLKYDIVREEGQGEMVTWFDTVQLSQNFQFILNFSGDASNFFEESISQKESLSEELRLTRLKKDEKIRASEDQLDRVSRKYEMTVGVVQNLMSPQRPLSSRFHPDQLDSLLKFELRNKGISIDFNYGVFAPHPGRFVLLTNNAGEELMKESELRASLFPNDVFGGSQSSLIVNFPDKRNYLFSKIWSSLISSGILVAVILFCFGYSIHTIVRQKKLSEMKNDFVNNMTHELKTPISTVSLAVEALNDKDIENSSLRNKYINVIGEENRRLGEQVEKVLQIAAIERRDYNLKEEILYMNEMVRDAAAHISMQVEQRGGRMNLIENAKSDRIKGDRTHITNIILNLLENANKYSPQAPNITLRTESDSQQFNFYIQDRGIGMTKEQIKHIFQKFYRVPTGDVHDVKGFGLGLSYVQKMVQAHHGKIRVDSTPGNGSKFLISLPLTNET